MDLSALELDFAVLEGKEGVVAADADVEAGGEFGPALADDDRAGGYGLAAVGLHAAILRVAVPAVAGAALSFFMCHNSPVSLFGTLLYVPFQAGIGQQKHGRNGGRVGGMYRD